MLAMMMMMMMMAVTMAIINTNTNNNINANININNTISSSKMPHLVERGMSVRKMLPLLLRRVWTNCLTTSAVCSSISTIILRMLMVGMHSPLARPPSQPSSSKISLLLLLLLLHQ